MKKFEGEVTDLLGEEIEMVPQDSSSSTKGTITEVRYESHEQVWTWEMSNGKSFHNHDRRQPIAYVRDDYVKTEWVPYYGEPGALAAETVKVLSKSQYGDLACWFGVVESILVDDGRLSVKLFGHADPVHGKVLVKK